MNTKKATKRALLTSVMALVMCVVMLVGTTFAWFTDTASTGVNKIQAGTLKVDIVKADGETSIRNESMSFVNKDGSANILWEPGATFMTPAFKIKSTGSLALKYKLTLNGITGDNMLLDVITFSVVKADGAEVDLDTFEGHLTPDAALSEALYIKGHMDETANNDYQGKTLEGLGITVVATQDTVESDSFNNQYDKDAVYGDVMVSSDAELKAAIEDPTMKVIAVNGDLTYDWGSESYENSKALNMKGKTFLGANDAASITFAGYGSANPIVDATFRNITIKDSTVGDNEASWEHGYLEFKNLTAVNVTFANSIMMEGDFATFKNCSFNSNKDGEYAVWVANGDATFEGCTFTGPRGVKVHEAYGSEVGTVVIDNNTFAGLTQKPGVVIGTVNADTTVAIKDSKFVGCQAGDQGLYIYETDTDVTTFNFVDENNNVTEAVQVKNNTEFDTAIANGASTVVLGSGNYIIPDSAQGKTLTIVGNGNTVVANQNDGSYEGCDYSLDGSTVTFEGVTINTDGHTYAGYARCRATYNNCTINGSYTLYGESVFNNCTFNVTGDYYNIWTWGGKNIKFNDCTFNTDGKSILVYNQTCDVYVDGCTFNDRTNGANFTKSAFETGVDGVGAKYNIYINDTTVKGFAENDKCVGYKNIVGNKNSMSKEYLNIVINGVDVY